MSLRIVKGFSLMLMEAMRFALLIWDKDEPVSVFPAAFYLQDVQSLEGKAEQDKFLKMPMELVRICAPETLSIPEVRSERHLEVFAKLYQENPLLGDPKKGWQVGLVAELHRTNDSNLFRSDGQGWPLMEGKCFHQFLPDYEKPAFTVDPDQGLKRTARCKYYKDGLNGFLHMMPRLRIQRRCAEYGCEERNCMHIAASDTVFK